MTEMEGTTPLLRTFCILTLVICEMLTTAYMIQEPTIHADSTDQTDVRTDQIAMLTKRIDELEQSRAEDVKELNVRTAELSKFRENDVRAFTKLKDKVEEQTRLRVNDLHLITVLTARIQELERQCGNVEHSENDISQHTQNPAPDKKSYHNGSDVSFHSPAATLLDNTTKNEEESTTNLTDTTKSEAIRGHGRIRSRQPERKTRVSPSDGTVAFHAILTHTISDPTTNHVIVFDKVITNTGGAHYSTNTGSFTATQSGVHVFAWAIGVPSNQFIYSDLVRNNAVIGSALTGEGDGYESATSATAAVHLEVGDEVWVRVDGHSGGSDLHGTRSMFTGFRLG